MLRTLAVTLTILAVSGMAFAAPIGTVYLEDFEAQTVGVPPGPSAPPEPYWHHSTLSYCATPRVQENIHGNPGKLYQVHASDDDKVWGTTSTWVFTAPDDHPEEMIFTFDLWNREYDAGIGVRVCLVDKVSGWYRQIGIQYTYGTDGITIYDPSGSNDLVIGDGLREAWQSVELIVNTNTSTVSASVDGGTPVVTTYTPNAGHPTPDSVEIYAAGTKLIDWYALDNIRVEVIPEPVTLAFLAIGGLFTLLKRRSR